MKKYYNYIADLLSKEISNTFECECNVFISSRNGDDLKLPRHVIIQTSKPIVNKKKVALIFSEIIERDVTKELLFQKPYLPIPGGGNGYVASLNIK